MNMKFTGLLAKLSSFSPHFDGTVQMFCNSITKVPIGYPSKTVIYMCIYIYISLSEVLFISSRLYTFFRELH